MIRFEDVHFAYGARRPVEVLRAVTFEMAEGTLGILLGPGGSGKSTLLRIAAGLLSPRCGKVTVAGRRITLLGRRARTAVRGTALGYAPQTPRLLPFLTALENVLLSSLAVKSTAPRKRAEQLLSDLGMGHRAGHLPRQLSASERQRCALAAALLLRPKVLLADAPTAGLDPETAQTVFGMLAASRDEGATVLVACQQPVETLTANRRFRLADGRLEG